MYESSFTICSRFFLEFLMEFCIQNSRVRKDDEAKEFYSSLVFSNFLDAFMPNRKNE